MTSAPVVSNASPLTALEQIGQLQLLEQLLRTCHVAGTAQQPVQMQSAPDPFEHYRSEEGI